MDDALQGLLDFVQSVDPALRTILAGVAVLLETSILIGLIVPGDTVVLVASIGVEDLIQAFALAVAVIVGALIGESVGFALGRWIGPRIRRSWLGRRIGENQWQRAENYLHRRGGIAIFLSRFLPMLHSLVPLTVGMSGYSYRRFLAWTFPACVLWTGLYIGIAAGAAGTYRELADQLGSNAHWLGYIFVGILVVFLLVVWGVKKLLHRIEERHMEKTPDEATGARQTGVDAQTGRRAGDEEDAA